MNLQLNKPVDSFGLTSLNNLKGAFLPALGLCVSTIAESDKIKASELHVYRDFVS